MIGVLYKALASTLYVLQRMIMQGDTPLSYYLAKLFHGQEDANQSQLTNITSITKSKSSTSLAFSLREAEDSDTPRNPQSNVYQGASLFNYKFNYKKHKLFANATITDLATSNHLLLAAIDEDVDMFNVSPNFLT